MTKVARWTLACSLTLLSLVSVLGCGGGTPAAPGDSTSDSMSADGAWVSSNDTLTFQLPASFSAENARTRQTGTEQLLATATMQGIAGPEVREGETTRVPLTFDLRGRGSIEVTKWRVEVRHQTSGNSQEQTKSVTEGDASAAILFAGLATGRYDCTIELYGMGSGDNGTMDTGNLLFELDVLTDDASSTGDVNLTVK